jgi:outer membrane protein OmpA-like peptidoglycan-associated protein
MKHTYLAIAAAAIFASGCETAPKDEGALAEARNAVAKAQADPNVTRYAATELDRAQKLLTNAEAAADDSGAADQTAAHYAYLATQVARIAEQRAHAQVAAERIKAGEVERQKILLSARETEVQRARAEALNAQSQVAQAQAAREQLAAQLEDLQASQTDRGIVLTLDDVLFDTGRAELKAGAQRSLDQIASFLEQNPERSVQIEGFTDSQGPDDYNLELSQKRADAVAMAIMQRGVEAQRVRAMGYGEKFPVASNTSAGSRQMNRRVEIIVSNDDGAIPGRTASGSP